MTVASGIGSWPGTDVRWAIGLVRELLAEGDAGATASGSHDSPVSDARDLPYLPELPDRGPGADLIGRSAGLLADLAVDLQPSGWRLVDRAGRDAGRTRSWWRQDLDELAEAYDGYAGPLKVQVAGPWTLAAELRVSRGERVVVDPGACRDVAESLTEGLRAHLAELHRLVPGASFVVQLDEPSLPAVLAGRLPTSSGYGTHRAVDPQVARQALAGVVDALHDRDVTVVAVHCCAAQVPVPLLRAAGADAIALDVSLLDRGGWAAVAEAVEAGVALWAGIDTAPRPPGTATAEYVRDLLTAWTEVGLPVADLDRVTLTPACGLAATSPDEARAAQRRVRDTARALTDHAAG